MNALQAALAAVVAGDMHSLPQVLDADHIELQRAALEVHSLTVSRLALTKVLRDWGSGAQSADDVQKWASFVRRGYVAGGGDLPIHPIEIKYDAHDEGMIAEIIARFDEIGDWLDGQIEANERAAMLRILAD